MTAHHNAANPETYADRDVKALKDPDASHRQAALEKMQQDSHVMSSKGHAAEQKYWDTMKSKGGDSLPDLKFTKEGDHVAKVEGKDGKVLYDNHAIAKGEGPYQALRRQGLNHHDALDQAHKIKKETGRDSFNQHEKLKVNPDGSVSSREDNKNDGGYKETIHKDGNKKATAYDKDQKPQSVVEDRKDGSHHEWKRNPDNSTTTTHQPDKDHKTTVHRDKDGHKIDETKDETAPDKTRKVETTDKDGNKRTETYDKDKHQNSVIQENKDGSATGWRRDAQGNMTTIDQADAKHRTETTNDPQGKFVSETKTSTDGEGTKTTTVLGKDESVRTDIENASGEKQQSISVAKDGSKVGWKKGPNGETITVNEPAPTPVPAPAPVVAPPAPAPEAAPPAPAR